MPSPRRVQWIAAISAVALAAALSTAAAGAQEATDREATDREVGVDAVAAQTTGTAHQATVDAEIDLDDDSLTVLGVYPILTGFKGDDGRLAACQLDTPPRAAL